MTEKSSERATPRDGHEGPTPVRWLSDRTLAHLRRIADWPDLSGTRYRVIEVLARGGMGTIYLAEDRDLGRQVALKVLHGVHVSTEIAARMLQEARVIARLEHPGIVPVHEVGKLPDGRILYVMKLVRGRRLDELVSEATPVRDLLRILEKVCDSVAFAHAHGVIHRDLKPENIMIGSFGEVLVMDWGLAKLLRHPDVVSATGLAEESSRSAAAATSRTTAHGTVLGTPAYMAPEQVLGRVDLVDERSDVYALGAILHFMLTGSTPPQTVAGDKEGRGAADPTAQPGDRVPSIPRALEAICRKALSRERERRYAGAAELGAEISRFLDGMAVSAHREGLLEKAGRLVSKYRAPILLILAYLLMRTVLLFFTGS